MVKVTLEGIKGLNLTAELDVGTVEEGTTSISVNGVIIQVQVLRGEVTLPKPRKQRTDKGVPRGPYKKRKEA